MTYKFKTEKTESFESKTIYEEFYNNYKRLFSYLNLTINFDIVLWVKNNITDQKFILEKKNNDLLETITNQNADLQHLKLSDNQKAFISKPFFMEVIDTFIVTGILIINDFENICKSVEISLLKTVLNELHSSLNQSMLSNNHQPLVNKCGKSLLDFGSKENFINIFNAIAALKYESKTVCSQLLITSDKVITSMDLDIRFETPIEINNYKTIRKLLEVSTNNNILIGSDNAFYGFKDIDDFFDTIRNNDIFSKESIYVTYFKDTLVWDVYKYDEKVASLLPYISSNMTNISYPIKQISKEVFVNKVSSTFRCYNDESLWTIITNAVTQKSGTMIVITEGAKEEAERLEKCCIKINKIDISKSDIVKNISAIDGAILCDPYGCCYAIGVILDGIHSKDNDEIISRGARYNSAHRYAFKNKYNCLIAIISEDGDVNLVQSNSSENA